MLDSIEIIGRILRHPIAKNNKLKTLTRFIRWQIGARLLGCPVIASFVDDTKIIAEKGLTVSTGNIYTGIEEFESMSYVIHSTRKKDTFVDVGANVGPYTILASGVCGANSVAIEPVDKFYNVLNDNVRINRIEDIVKTERVIISSSREEEYITTGKGAENHVTDKDYKNSIELNTKRLDEIVDNEENTLIIKIDVEGYEYEVLKSGEGIFNEDRRVAIIVEISNLSKKFGFDMENTHEFLSDKGFSPVKYDPFSRSIEKTEMYGDGNTIYVNDIKYFEDRVELSNRFEVLGRKF